MTTKKFFFSLLALFVATTAVARAEPKASRALGAEISLEDCVKKAIAQSESLAIRESDLRLAQAQYDESFGDIYPKVHFLMSQKLQDKRGNSNSFNSDSSSNSSIGNFSTAKKNRGEGYLNIRQPIFSGFKDFALVRSAKAELKARNLDASRAKETLYQSVAEAFYQILLYRSDASELAKARSAIQERIKELGEFIKLGKSKESEILAAESELSELEASEAATSGALLASEELLSFLIGESARGIRLKVDKSFPIADTLEANLLRLNDRPDLKAARQREISAQNNVLAAEGSRYPVISAEANYYAFESPEVPRDWELFLRFDLPLFEGFKIDAKVQQQRELLTQSRLLLNESQRLAERDVRVAHANLLSSISEAAKLFEFLSATKKSYAAQRKDYEQGIVTNIDVLQALRRLYQAEQRYEASRLTVKLNQVKLDIAVGGVSL